MDQGLATVSVKILLGNRTQYRLFKGLECKHYLQRRGRGYRNPQGGYSIQGTSIVRKLFPPPA